MKKISILFISISILVVWSYVFGFFHNSLWNIPTGYGGDLFWVLSMAKSYMQGDIYPFFYKSIDSLNAPYGANWSDFPITEEFIFMSIGYLAKFTNLFFSHNIILLLAHISAGIVFYLVASELKCKDANAISFAILFGLSHFLFLRGSAHIILTYVFLIPVSILILFKIFDEKIDIKSKTFLVFFLLSFLIGCFNPYYTFMFCIFLLFLFIYNFLKEKKNIYIILLYILSASLGFLLMNADSIYSNLVNGPNIKAVGRNLAALEVYGMKMPELFLPPSGHRIEQFSNFAMSQYYHKAYVRGESWSSYIGVVGLAGFIVLIFNSLQSIKYGWKKIEIASLIAINWIFLYSLIGGINLILGVLNFQIFRAPNRFSIYIYCIILLYLCIKSSNIRNNILRWSVSGLVLIVGLIDNLPRVNLLYQEPIKNIVNEDIAMGQSLMSNLEKGSMVFQFPFMEFPEVGPIKKMGDYEHLRPFIHTNDIKFTYGNNKGRGIELWQSKIEFDENGNFIEEIENYGFGAIYFNKKAYGKDELAHIKDIFKFKNKNLFYETAEILIYKIDQNKKPDKINQATIYDYRWSSDEGTHRWAKRSDAKITFFCCEKIRKDLNFKINSIDLGKFEIFLNQELVNKGKFTEVGKYIDINIDSKKLKSKNNDLLIKTNIKRRPAGHGDLRLLTFSIKDFNY